MSIRLLLSTVARFIWFALVPLLGARKASATSLPATAACALIARSISRSSAVFYPFTAPYAQDIQHFALSSEQNSTCTVEPGNTADVGAILRILGTTRVEFAVKGGGHNLNPGFSSTLGVQISMTRFNRVDFSPRTQTVDIGSGLLYDEVYAALEPYNVSVVGARATGIGIAGFIVAGGGYSYKGNQYGMAIDTVTALEVVLPTGQVKTVTEELDSDLFFALRGGGNNFGIVTRFTLQTHRQTAVWGGTITYTIDQVDAASAAVLNYTSNNTDPKTGFQCSFASIGGQGVIMVYLFYDAPSPPAGLFDAFLAIPAAASDVSTRSYLSFILSANTNLTANMRGIYDTVSHTAVTPALIRAMVNETTFYSNALQQDSLALNGYVIEPFIPQAYHRGKTATPYPPTRSENIHPMNIYYAWTDPKKDETLLSSARASSAHLRTVAASEGILASALYPNYAIFGTALEAMYGANAARLHAIKRRVDPADVMGLAGGFKF